MQNDRQRPLAASYYSLLILIMCSCNSPTAKIEKINRRKFAKFEFSKLIGKWTEQGSNNRSIEEWSWDKDSTLHGRAYEVIGKDTIQIDRLKIKDLNYKSEFGAAVRNRYLGDYMWFEEIMSNRTKVVFQNKNSGFPRKITYSIMTNNNFSVLVEGEIHDDHVAHKFVYQKKEQTD